MAKVQLNIKARYQQYKNLLGVVGIAAIIVSTVIVLFSNGDKKSISKINNNKPFEGILDDNFSSENLDNALSAQQLELTQLKEEISRLKAEKKNNKNSKETLSVNQTLLDKFEKRLSDKFEKKYGQISNAQLTQNRVLSTKSNLMGLKNKNNSHVQLAHNQLPHESHTLHKTGGIYTSYNPYYEKADMGSYASKNASNYVPSGTFVKAVVLGGADSDASVNAQRKNNSAMLFKLISNGTLPNQKQSRLKGCFVTASSYGDISSERAYISLKRLSCTFKNGSIIDKEVHGWVFYSGKVGIKGQPLMRDSKVMQWAGISGALSGIAGAAQYAQSVQSFNSLGATSVVPGNRVLSYSGLGGTSKAADTLSNYYVKRAEQYHPVIQIGAGSSVMIVFREGFSLFSGDSKVSKSTPTIQPRVNISDLRQSGVPESVLKSFMSQGNPQQMLSNLPGGQS